MQYTPAQLVALVEEARGHVHEVMMGAIWNEERYERCRDFMERTNIVEYQPGTGNNLVQMLKPLPKAFQEIDDRVHRRSPVAQVANDLVSVQPMPADTMEKAMTAAKEMDRAVLKLAEKSTIKVTPVVPPPTRGRPPSLGHIKPGSIRAMAEAVAAMGYRIPEINIDAEAANLRARHLPASRDLARAIVKELRAMAAQETRKTG